MVGAALLGTASLGILGFAAVVLTTEFWQQQPVLASGLDRGARRRCPGFVAGKIRAIAAAQERAAAANADRRRALLLIADNLRAPLAAARALGAAASELGDVLDFAALDAGSFAAPVEAFDLRLLVTRSLMPLQAAAAEAGVLLRWRVDPHLPCRLRGRAQALARILASLAGHAIDVPRPPGRCGSRSTWRPAMRVGCGCGSIVESAGGDQAATRRTRSGALALLLVRRLVALMGGAFAIERAAGRGRTRLAVTLALAIEEGAAEPILDLAKRLVLIATEDEEFAGELAEPIAGWHGDVRWAGDADAALAGLFRHDTGERPHQIPVLIPILIIDGRGKLLWALSLAHRAARLGPAVPFILLVAGSRQIESLGEVDGGEVDGFIPLPLSRQLLANALDALPPRPPLPLMPGRQCRSPPTGRRRLPSRPPGGAPEEPWERGQFSERITPIAAHPKFVPEAAALDMRAIDGLRALDGDPDFLGELIETFQTDAQQIMERLDQAVAAADAAGFAQSLVALRRAAETRSAAPSCASSWHRCRP